MTREEPDGGCAGSGSIQRVKVARITYVCACKLLLRAHRWSDGGNGIGLRVRTRLTVTVSVGGERPRAMRILACIHGVIHLT